MKFNLEKKGYNKIEVDKYIESLQKSMSEQKQRIIELRKQNNALEREIYTYQEKKELITKALEKAVNKAEEIEQLAKIKYNREMEQLKAFHERWISFYNKLIKQYPDNLILSDKNFNEQMSKILSGLKPSVSSEEKIYDKESERIAKIEEEYDPLKKIKTFLKKNDEINDESLDEGLDNTSVSKEEKGFSLDEALHPKEDLEQIMKDLGLMED